MSEHEDRHSAQYWDERYSAEPVWSGNPNPALVAEVSGLPAGRALDVGCGEGADSVWLATQGWEVTALDISAKAVERTRAVAERAGVAVHGVASGLLEAPVEREAFDLVSVMYPAILRTPAREAENRLLDLVAPGGTLLVVHHADVDREHALTRGFDPEDYVSPEDVRGAAAERAGWTVLLDERRERAVEHGAGAHHKHDLVVRLQRD